MPIQSRKNQYLGINAHFHSFMQTHHKWNRFHGIYNTYLVASLQDSLEGSGYRAEYEESLQIQRWAEPSRRPQADILVVDERPANNRTKVPTLLQDAPMLLSELTDEVDETSYSAIGIYDAGGDAVDLVAWLELLSPTNKGNTPDAYKYRSKRQLLLEQGVVFAEIDYLHMTPPTFSHIPNYTKHQKQSFPYRLAVIDPRHNDYDAMVYLKEFSVDMPIPNLVVPLYAGDSVTVLLDDIYQKTFWEHRYGTRGDIVYDQFPSNFESYSPQDRARIATRMLHVHEAHQNGNDLLQTPPILETLDLTLALKKLADLGII
jgi:hypothetical protein